MCQPKNLQCVKEIVVIDEKCRKSCEGFYVTSYFKSKLDEGSFADFWTKVEADYMKYKGIRLVDFPDELKGV